MIRGVTVGERLREERRSRFVGREAELELVRQALDEPDRSFTVLFIHGPGGVGKTALMRAIADLCESEGAPAIRLDLRSIEPSPPAFRNALAELLEAPGNVDIAGLLQAAGPRVLMLDTYESAGALDPWLRDRFLPTLPAHTFVVIAGRGGPDRQWLADPGWRE
ncbi:MAG TPA: ATP-binding protein, partial [Solirubrobacterales bacterium]|nr:ATP-binding protein [Solirubrobacterales bacterium]